jgi:hypothetical protein
MTDFEKYIDKKIQKYRNTLDISNCKTLEDVEWLVLNYINNNAEKFYQKFQRIQKLQSLNL